MILFIDRRSAAHVVAQVWATCGLTLQSYSWASASVLRHEYDAALLQRSLNCIAVWNGAALRPSFAFNSSDGRERHTALVSQRLLTPIKKGPGGSNLTGKKHYFHSHAF